MGKTYSILFAMGQPEVYFKAFLIIVAFLENTTIVVFLENTTIEYSSDSLFVCVRVCVCVCVLAQ